MDQIKKEHIIQAIKEIDKEGIRPGYNSTFYDVIFNGRPYPPKLMVSIANRLATGEELDHKNFHGGPKYPAFKLLEKHGFKIVKKKESNMNVLDTYLQEFALIADDWFEQNNWLKDRYLFFQKFFTEKFLENATWEDFQEMGNNIHAFTSMNIAKANALGRMNLESIEDYRRIFLYIISKKDPINLVINNLQTDSSKYKLPYFGDSAISELIAYAFPNDYVTYNSRDIEALKILGLKLPQVKKEAFGDKFLRYNELLKPILEAYEMSIGHRTQATIPLELDQFFSWLHESKKADKPLKNLIERYKNRIKNTHLEEEVYKWQFIDEHKGKPNVHAEDFNEEIKSIKLGNLVYAMSGAVINHLAKEKPEELRNIFKDLFKEATPLEERIKKWNKEIDKLHKSLGETLGHHQDERAISVYLTLHDPERYTFYKNSYYQKFCKLIGEKSKGKGKKYRHYLDLIQWFVDDYITQDPELIDLVKSIIPNYYDGSNHLLLAQDILYEVLERNDEEAYWIFQGNPAIYDLKSALNNNHLQTWKVAAHKDKIKNGDKVILWLTGDKAGCYAIAKVKSEVGKISMIHEDAQYYKTDQKDKVDRVEIEIEHNLSNTPILWHEIKDLMPFKNFKAGNQGTNFSATKEEYETIISLVKPAPISDYQKVKNCLDSNKIDDFISFLRSFVRDNKIDPKDQRITFNVNVLEKRLAFIIGNRYVLSIGQLKNKTIFSFLSKEVISKHSGEFKNHRGEVEAYWNEVDSIDGLEAHIAKNLQKELERNHKSPFRKYINQDFISDIFQMNIKIDPLMTPLNKILFGPPGTGKTYTLKNKYFQKYTSKETSISPERNFENVVKDLSWWQVIALALLDLGKSKVSDIFENRWVKEKTKLSQSKTIRPTLWGQLQSHTIETCEFVNVKNRQAPYIFNKTEDSYWEILEDEVKEQTPELYEIKDRVDNFKPNPDKEIKRYKFTTFHQSFSYEDFIEGIKPKMRNGGEETEDLTYEIQSGIFKQLCLEAQNDPENKYAIFIDEINRGNISNIFGELITLIEPDKRKGETNEMSALLPYSKKKFSVPNNVDIYGTMNTADRSVESLDTALRRRFTFKEIMPNSEIIRLEGKNNGIIRTENDIEINLAKLLTKINERIEVLIDRDHTIGHSYFMDIYSTEQLKLVFKDKIIPLLQEYFYGDYGKIGLVLGNGFVKLQKKKDNLFADFSYERKDELNNDFYTLKAIDDSFSIIAAIEQLMHHSESN